MVHNKKLHSVAPPAESSGLRAKALKNLPCLVRPGERKEATGRDGEPWVYHSCDVVVLDSTGIKERGSDVRIAWVRTLNQLEDAVGNWIAVRPVEDGQSVILEPLEGADLAVAERVLDEIDDG
jgi:hypothetical protein